MTQSFITVISTAFLLGIAACSSNSEKKEYKTGSLLLPEHQDTTTIYQPLPDSVFYGVSYNNPQNYKGKLYNRITFKHLAKVTRVLVPMEEDVPIEVLDFSDEVKSLDGQEIIIKGFLLPAIHTKDMYVLSAHPYSKCFFCNKAGVESIMEMHMEKPIPNRPKVDQIVIVKGRLKLYNMDPNHLPYTLENSQIIGYL